MFASIASMTARGLRRGASLLILLALPGAGCLPESREPITPAEQAVEEPGLLGLWGAAIEDGALHVHILRGEGAALEVLVISHEPDGSGDLDTYQAHVSLVGERRFANLHAATATEPDAISDNPAPYLLLGFELPTPDELTVRFLAEETVSRAIERGELIGEMDDAGEGVSIVITDESARIASFLAGADPATLFDQSFTFRRLSPPKP